MSRAYNFCNNCGETGHAFHQCKKPITSIGIIVYKEVGEDKQRQYLMICRKDTLGFVDFMRGKYHLHDNEHQDFSEDYHLDLNGDLHPHLNTCSPCPRS